MFNLIALVERGQICILLEYVPFYTVSLRQNIVLVFNFNNMTLYKPSLFVF